jgi:aminopeptidase
MAFGNEGPRRWRAVDDSALDKLARVLVRYSTATRPGDVVSLVGPPPAEPLLLALYREVLAAGGHPFASMQPQGCTELLYRHASPAQLAFVHPLERTEVEAVDVSIHVLARQTADPGGAAVHDRHALHRRARRTLMESFLSRAARRTLRWVVAQFPCAGVAEAAGMTLADYRTFLFRAGLLDHDDPEAAWRERSARQARLADFLGRSHDLRLVTPAGTDLRLGVAGRTWINGDGHENFPDGEVFTGPVEDATEGTVFFDFPAVHGSRVVEGVRLVFRAGRVVEASAANGEDFLVRMLDQDPGARILGEVALGCNYAITRPTRNPLLDEKIGGTFHLALGASYPGSGGTNQSALHWDMVGDLRRGGRVEADGRVISAGGRFVDAAWPQPEN